MRKHRSDFVPLTINQTVAVISLTQGKHAIIDAVDWSLVCRWKWSFCKGYAVRGIRSGLLTDVTVLHQVLFPGLKEMDHKNQNGLDNQRNNLRPCTHSQNCANSYRRTGKPKGVYFDKRRPKHPWKSSITVKGKYIHLGVFASADEAAKAYDSAATTYFGEFAYMNKLLLQEKLR